MSEELNVVETLPARGKVDWAAVAEKARELHDEGKVEAWVEVPIPLYSGVLTTFKKNGIVALPVGDYEMTTQRIEGDSRRRFFVRVR